MGGEMLSTPLRCRGDPASVPEMSAFHEFERQSDTFLGLLEAVNRSDVRMIEGGEDLRLAAKPRHAELFGHWPRNGLGPTLIRILFEPRETETLLEAIASLRPARRAVSRLRRGARAEIELDDAEPVGREVVRADPIETCADPASDDHGEFVGEVGPRRCDNGS